MASMPELGSKISLISKSDIRYEGQLYTVDPNECTIALANVRSYGTEDRDAQYSIPPQEEIFDYILFRGSDIKDIRVVNNVPRVPNDPAIMQMQVSNPMGGQQNFQPQFPMPVMPHVNAQMGPFGTSVPVPAAGPYNALSGLGALGGSAPGTPGGPSVAGLPFGQQQQAQQNKAKQASELIHGFPDNSSSAVEQNNQASVLDLIGGSRSTTPVSLNSRKSPTAEMGVQVNQKDGNRRNQNGNNRSGQQHPNQHDRRDSGRLDSQGSLENRNQRNNQYQPGNRGVTWVRNNNQNVRNNNNNNQRPQRRGPHQQVFRQNLNNQSNKGRPKTTIKFESDYDFEQANSKFEEMRLSLAKLKVEEAKPEQVNGETDKKDDSGNETGAGEQEPEEDDVTVGYDKAKSFFDNISCEAATDRKGKNRTDWRHERKINSETFGVSSARRGGFYNYNRGRTNNSGNFYNNRNSGQNYRNNGYNNSNNGGYRMGNNYRNSRNFNQRNPNQGNNQQQETSATSLPQEKPQTVQQAQKSTAQPTAVAAGGNK